MLRRRFDSELQRLENEVLELGNMVQTALRDAVEHLRTRDLEGSQRVIEGDVRINAKRFQIEADVLVLIATQQPIARDLRALAAILEIIRELERTGDYAKGIGKINLLIGEQELIKPLMDIPRMAEKTLDMLDRALKAYIERDMEGAIALSGEDDEVDNLYNQVRRELMTIVFGDPAKVEQANLLLWAAHNLERAADRVTNICERIVFFVTGTLGDLKTTDPEDRYPS
jgi:phosphate transport system protein